MNTDCFAYKPLIIDYTSLTFQLSEYMKAIMTEKVTYLSSGNFTMEEALNLSRSDMENESAMDLSKVDMENENVIDLSKVNTVTEARRASVIVTAKG